MITPRNGRNTYAVLCSGNVLGTHELAVSKLGGGANAPKPGVLVLCAVAVLVATVLTKMERGSSEPPLRRLESLLESEPT